MKTRLLKPALIASIGWMVAGQPVAQTFTNLYTFTGASDGAKPFGGLLLSSNRLYGSTFYGGDSGHGAIFAINLDGTGFATLYSFTGTTDGAGPHGALIVSGSTLYGTAGGGGAYGNGTVFAINSDGTGFQTLHTFTTINTGTNTDGKSPVSALVLSGDTLYGTALYGGGSGNGTVFKVRTDGTGFATLHSFSPNPDGAFPIGALILSGNVLYGTASGGGAGGGGTVFALNIDGTSFRTLHSFSANTPANRDGAGPNCELFLWENTLYGTARNGGSGGSGVLFSVNTSGTGFSVLHSFPAVDTNADNSDGASPQCEGPGLILLGNNLYGTATDGGANGSGTVFVLGTNGANFTVLYTFSASDGDLPYSGLVPSGNVLYGAATYGGTAGNGTIFSISLPSVVSPPQLTITPAGREIVLSWSTDSSFALQSATNLISPVWTTNLPAPVIVNGQNTVTNPLSSTQQFFRLSQ